MGKGDTTNRQSSNVYNSFGRKPTSEHGDNSASHGHIAPDDSRISKLLRLLSRENDPDKFCSLAEQLQQSFKVPENGRYIRRTFDLITKSLLDLLRTGPGSEAKFKLANCLGRFGYLLDQNFKRYIDWIFSTYSVEQNKEVCLLLMKALYETLKLDKDTRKTEVFASKLMSNLVNVLEFTDSADFFVITVDAILVLTEMYPVFFTKHFRDTVDILVGWHIDSSQGSYITEYASRSLQRLNRYWIDDVQFCVTLISQFFEDMEAYADGVYIPCDQSEKSPSHDNLIHSSEKCILKLTSLIKVFNTVLQCMGEYLNPTLSPTITWTFLIRCFTKMLEIVLLALECLVREELIITANECTSLLMKYLQPKISSNSVKLHSLIKLELDVANSLSNEAVLSVITFTTKILVDASATVPVELVQQILRPDSPVLKLRFSSSQRIQNAVLGIYHSLLNLKNISPLQEAYKYIMGDLEVAYKKVVPSVSALCQSNVNPFADVKYNEEDVEMVIMFHMKALADLAKASSSIIGIWALQPSILELFAVKLQLYHENLVNYSPVLQYCMLYLLYTHCVVNNNFVSSSTLVNVVHDATDVCDILGLPLIISSYGSTTSPTSGYLSVILNVLTQILSNISSNQILSLTLDWTADVITQVKSYFSALQDAQEFRDLLQALVCTGHTHDETIVLQVLKNLEELFSSSKILWKQPLISNVLNLCLLHSNSSSDYVSDRAFHLMELLPWYITVNGIQKLTEAKTGNTRYNSFSQQSLHDIQKHISKRTSGKMQDIQFKKLMGYVLNGNQYADKSWMLDLFSSCCHGRRSRNHATEDDKTIALCNHLARANKIVLMSSLSMQAAQFCVTTKLRTPLGKPQDTFTSIECAITDLARELHIMFNISELENRTDTLNIHPNSISSSSSVVSESLITVFETPNCSVVRIVPIELNSSNSTPSVQQDSEQDPLLPSQKESSPFISSPYIRAHEEGWEQRRVRLLLEFLEQLEKCIYNAAEGSATLSPPSKTVRMFFHTNKSTCAQWLARIRMAVLAVALHAGQATAVVRHAYCLLEDLVESKNTHGVEFERTVLYLSWAFCQLHEPRAIIGLIAWCLGHGRKFQWLQAVAEQAAGRYESAADNYKRILEMKYSENHMPSTSNSKEKVFRKHSETWESEILLNEFISDQLTNCYLSLKNWEDFLKWKQQEQQDGLATDQSSASTKNLFGNGFTIKEIQAMNCFEERGLSALAELEKWNNIQVYRNLVNVDKCWNSCILTKQVESTLVNMSLKLAAYYNKDNTERENIFVHHSWMKTVIEHCMVITQRHIQESSRNMPSEMLQNYVILHFAGAGLLSVGHGEPEKNTFTINDSETKYDYVNSSVLSNVLWWAIYFDQMCSKKFCNQVNILCLEVARIARKEGNYKLAKKSLLRFLNYGICFGTNSPALKQISLEQVMECLINSSINFGQMWNTSTTRAFIEVAKLQYYSSCHKSAVRMCAIMNLTIMQKPTSINFDFPERISRTLLTLAKWLQIENHLVNDIRDLLTQVFALEISNHCEDIKILNSVTSEHFNFLLASDTHVIPDADAVIGRLLYMSVCQCPALAKSWNTFAAWCYRWGRRSVDGTNEIGGQLTDTDRNAIQRLLPPRTLVQDLEEVFAVFTQKDTAHDEEDIEMDDSVTEKIEARLKNVSILREISHECLSHIVEIWRSAKKRVYVYYELSAEAYFKFLALCSNEGTDGAIITASLRLLRLIAKHSHELQEVLERGLNSTPTRPWKGIIPQLFSRLSHPEPYVIKHVSELLCRVAVDAPHLITFPAIVGAATGARLTDIHLPSSTKRILDSSSVELSEKYDIVGDLGKEEDDDDEDDELGISDAENKSPVLKNCFQAMVDFLANQFPETVSHVKLLVQELRRITLLWDELWLGTLVQHQAEIALRLSQLEQEVTRVDENLSLDPDQKKQLIAEKYRIILKPIVFVLEQLQSITSVPPETPHEKLFQEKYGVHIKNALQKLKQPANPRRPHESWQPMKQLQTLLQQRFQKRAAYTIHMSNVSPILAEIKKSIIAMPGVSSCERNVITIASVYNNVTMLPTKTKPKKLFFCGSDGQTYTYLLKGLEDLHLDERIMQFLRVSNNMMQRGSGTQHYMARFYSVIPLGPCSGLISWVDGVTPLFSLYKRWQQRQAVSAKLKSHASGSSPPPNGPIQVMRPSELFYNKLRPLLKEKGITSMNNRKDWPLSVLRQVLTDLMRDTPEDLLAKELWYNSINAGHWWQMTQTYSCSVAVMSMIGYIIGLGDRHLDNILADLNTGEVVHIDYNVCFEKGKSLRIPEKVPFRMTPNFRAALGVTGVEGIFRQTSEHVLKVMRKGRETLLTLLEAFVYDPLIDWKPGNNEVYAGAVYGQAVVLESKQNRKDLEREVTQSMFCIRMTEMKSSWLTNKDDVLVSVPQLEYLLEKLTDMQAEIKFVGKTLQDYQLYLKLVKEAEVEGPGSQNPLYTLGTRVAQYRDAKDAIEKARETLKAKLEDAEQRYKVQKTALASVRGTELDGWVAEVNCCEGIENQLVFHLVKEFLQNAGQNQMIVQYEQSEEELEQLSQQQTMLIHTCLDLMSQYGTIAGLYPMSYVESHRTACCIRWRKYLVENMSVEHCQEVSIQFQTLFPPDNSNNDNLCHTAVSFSYHLQSALQGANIRFACAVEKMASKGLPEGIGELERDYSEARNAVANFLTSEPTAGVAIVCVNAAKLCTLNKQYLMMEAAAASAGEYLQDLTFLDGEWFLDEMCFLSTLISEFCSLLPHMQNQTSLDEDEMPELRLAFQCLSAFNALFRSLKELNFNFHTIILPEALKSLQTEEPSVLSVITTLDNIIQSVGCPIADLLAQLELHLRYVIMDVESPHSNVQTIVFGLRNEYESLLLLSSESLKEPVSDEAFTPGQMLLMGFNCLFEKLQLESTTITAALESIEIPPAWKMIDQVIEAKALSAPVFSDRVRAVLDSILFLKRIQIIQDFFAMCTQIAGLETAIYDDDGLSKPIRGFTADFVRRRMFGVSSQTLALSICFLLQHCLNFNVALEAEQDAEGESEVSLEDLIRKAVDHCLNSEQISSATLTQVSYLTSNLENAWRHRELALRTQQEYELWRSTTQRLQLQLTAHHWLYEDLLPQNVLMCSLLPINRTTFMREVRKASSTLLALQAHLSDVQEHQNILVVSIAQRLKWVSGANPALTEAITTFDSAWQERTTRLSMLQRLSIIVGNTCNAILQYEALRTRTSEAIANDTSFLQMLDQLERSCILATSCNQAISNEEEALIQILAPEATADMNWLHKLELLISDKVKPLSKQKAKLLEDVSIIQKSLKKHVLTVRSFFAVHHRSMLDVLKLLRSMARSPLQIRSGLKDYLITYKKFSEYFSSLIRNLMSDDLGGSIVQQVLEQIQFIKEKTNYIYVELLDFADELREYIKPEDTGEGSETFSRPGISRQEGLCMSPKEEPPTSTAAKTFRTGRDPRTGKAVQERNAYAMGVWRRVRMKLEGRDPDMGRRIPVQEQVDFVTREAMNVDNLALLYEGWTPWV